MKLGAALNLRAQLQESFRDLQNRVTQNMWSQEGDTPVESPGGALAKLYEAYGDYEDLVARINITNTTTNVVYSGEFTSITELLARRDRLRLELAALRQIIAQTTFNNTGFRYSASEIKQVRNLLDFEVNRLREQQEQVQRDIANIENVLQEANWTVDLVD